VSRAELRTERPVYAIDEETATWPMLQHVRHIAANRAQAEDD
jgi:hypothetical protein